MWRFWVIVANLPPPVPRKVSVVGFGMVNVLVICRVFGFLSVSFIFEKAVLSVNGSVRVACGHSRGRICCSVASQHGFDLRIR